MKTIVLIIAMFNILLVCAGQEKEDTVLRESISTIVEEMPQFPGGDTALFKFIQDNVKYPEDAVKNKIQGRVYVQFVIDETGKVTNIEILRSVYPSLDEEAKRVVSMIPNWKPGKQKGKPVKVQFILPIVFKLE